MKIVEVNESNKDYVKQIAELEEVVFNKMNEDGREGQLFTTGYDDILDYALSKENSVFVMDDNGTVESAVYITQGQLPYTYNDITKYFKMGNNYKNYVASSFKNNLSYFKAMVAAYKNKVDAYKYAVQHVLLGSKFNTISEYLEDEIKNNGFHEKSSLRDGLYKNMAVYILNNLSEEDQKDYDRFFIYTLEDISNLSHIIDADFNLPTLYQGLGESVILEMEGILKLGSPTVYENNVENVEKYYNANTSNAVEIDTYITNPNCKSNGYAKILVFEGIKKHIVDFFKDSNNQEIYLCSTLHRDNFPSKYVSEFFGLVDNVFVNRRQGRDREVHIVRITREDYKNYLNKIAAKLAIFYGYNPDGTSFDESLIYQVKREQYEYEKRELERINAINDLGVNSCIIELKKKKLATIKL